MQNAEKFKEKIKMKKVRGLLWGNAGIFYKNGYSSLMLFLDQLGQST